MLNADRQHAFGLMMLALAMQIKRLNLHRQRALDAVVNSRHRQAALFADTRLGTGPDDLGVNQHQRLVAVLAHVDNDQPLMHIDLRRGQADTVGCVHRLQHGCGKLANAVVDHGDRHCHGMQTRVGVTEDGQ